jgi:peptidoglycan/LPS O-acetylase OafA/YrhL
MQYSIAKEPKNLIAKPKPIFDFQLEGLRGFTALLVVLCHIFTNNVHLDPNYTIQGIWQYSPPGHLSVLVFFVLSGYVIGLSNPKPIQTSKERWLYLKKRVIRIYPLYLSSILLSIIIAAIVSQEYFSPKTIALHLVFGQVAFTHVLSNNVPLWSLSYEVSYYLFFLIISAHQWKPIIVIAGCAALAILCRFTPAMPPVISSYACGACFWLIGLSLAAKPRTNAPVKYGLLLAYLLLMLSYGRMNLGISLLEHTGINFSIIQVPYLFERIVSLADFSYLIFCIPLLTRFTNRTVYGAIWLERIAFLVPGLYLIAYIASGKINNTPLYNTLFFAIVFYIFALLIYFLHNKPIFSIAGRYLMAKLTVLGNISYGIYIIHYPVIHLFSSINLFSGSTVTYLLRSALFIVLVLSLGWVLERRFQPWAKAKILG